ncbi:glycerate kinase [Clostridium botulinum]|uniref:Glycerate kinase n=1 Tax=Clostridium botulinum TaxID=1491 RepID=A0A6B4JIW1_CLOBO|nr:glycerate kinase [Clostridium botulinum]EES49793.1 glycerate kinase [Clostridium botulinum E1 str. 'BoNT E Beluga']MBY6760607.1 glycerate kinase [Clostridium botulinum]MBY6919514.1 glycerate kinase [Clostridium botulinum]MCR1130393.1 glycerate kinase [Clostridium botulinum]NFJ56853.1 glycerate kinase [Clostridium botulinum]
MKFVLAPDSFKESMTSKEACEAMERGIKKVIPNAECIKVPMADGGEGTVEALVESTNGEIHEVEVLNPFGQKVNACFGILGNKTTAVIEMATASGIQLIKREERNPLITTTYGTGELIKAALDKGIKHIIIGIGGSATNDGGAGMIQALGGKLLDSNGSEISFGGGALNKLENIDLSSLDSRLKDTTIEVACDVTNPLIGEKGASAIFGPQKGATLEMVKELDNNLAHYADVIKRCLGKDIAYAEGAGAAGGLGAALLAFLDGKLKRGIDLVIKHTDLSEKVKGADFLFTGEGSIDSQTIFGKTPIGVAKVAKKENVQTIAFAGRVGKGVENLYPEGIDAIFGILTGVTDIDEALALGKENLERCTENVARVLGIIVRA